MNFSITNPTTEIKDVKIVEAPIKETRSKDEKMEYLGKIIQLEEKLKEYRQMATDIPSSA